MNTAGKKEFRCFNAAHWFYMILILFWVLPSIALAENLFIDSDSSPVKTGGQNWEIFLNRAWVGALLLSDNKATLWVGTRGGLEERDAFNGRIKRVYTKQSGLPDNFVESFLSDGQGGIWVGTYHSGLVHLNADGTWKVFEKNNSDLPNNWVRSLFADDQGGIWVGTKGGGLVHLKSDDTWEVFISNIGSFDLR